MNRVRVGARIARPPHQRCAGFDPRLM